MQLREQRVAIPLAPGHLIAHMEKALSFRLGDGEVPVRVAVTAIEDGQFQCEIGCLIGAGELERAAERSIFAFERRSAESAGAFNAVYLVPTGIGAEGAFFYVVDDFLVVPEPGTGLLFGVGLAALWIGRRRGCRPHERNRRHCHTQNGETA